MKKFIALLFVFIVFLYTPAFCKILIPDESPGIIAISYFQNNTIKVALANLANEEKSFKISYGYYDLKPVKIQTKQIKINPEEILLFSFKYPKIKSGARLYDTVFISKSDETEELISVVHIQQLHASVNYFKCSKFFINEYNVCKLLLRLNPQKKENYFYILNNTPQTIPNNDCKVTLFAKTLIGLNELSLKDLGKVQIEKNYIEKIKQDAEAGKIFSGYGHLYLKLSVDNIKTPVIISPVIKEYCFENTGVSLGELTPPQVLFYPTDYTIREQQ